MFFIYLQDILAGILLTVLLMLPLVPIVDALDHFILSSKFAPLVILVTSILLIIFHPKSDKWTPTRYSYKKHKFFNVEYIFNAFSLLNKIGVTQQCQYQ